MAVRRAPIVNYSAMLATDGAETLTGRQRFALCYKVVAAHEATCLGDGEIDAAFFKARRVPVVNLRAARLTALDLKARGVRSALELRELGFDALDLTDAGFCSSCVSAYGAESVRKAFLLESGDAVALAGSVAVFQLDLCARRLLEACAGMPAAARAVLQQLEPRGAALHGVSVGVVLDAGLRAPALVELGYHAHSVLEQTGADGFGLAKLGF